MLIPELKVLNYPKSLDFYTRLAEFNVLYSRPETDFAMLEINGSCLMIEGFSPKTRCWSVGEMEKPFGRGMNLQVEVRDVLKLYQNFKRAAYPIFLDLEETWYRADDKEMGQKQFLVQDPDGYLLRFMQKMGIRAFSQ